MDWQSVTVIESAGAEPVHLDHAKKHCDVDIDEDDAYIGGLITAARECVEEWNNRALVTQTLEAALDCFPTCRSLKLPRAPLVSVESLNFTTSDGDETELDPDAYVVDTRAQPGRLLLQTDEDWPDDELQPGPSVVVRYLAGYATPLTARATTDIVTSYGRSFADGDAVRLSNSGGAVPAGLAERTTYYVRDASGSSFKLAETANGSAIEVTDDGTGQSFIGVVPGKLVHAILLLVAHWYENREAVQEARRTVLLELPLGVQRLVLSDRIWSF